MFYEVEDGGLVGLGGGGGPKTMREKGGVAWNILVKL